MKYCAKILEAEIDHYSSNSENRKIFTVISAEEVKISSHYRYVQKYLNRTIFSSKNRKIAKNFNFTRFLKFFYELI